MASETLCDWCEQPIAAAERSIRLSNRGGYASLYGTESISVTFHPECWDELEQLLRGAKPRPPARVVAQVGRFRFSVAIRGE